MSEPIRILVVDDHQMVREGIVSLVKEDADFQVCGEASHGKEALSLMETLSPPPQVILLDIHMPVMDGVDTARELFRRYEGKVGVLALTMVKQGMYIRKMLQAGARGYILKDCDKLELYEAIRAIHAGETYFTPAITQVVMDEMTRLRVEDRPPEWVSLTPREKEILQLIVQDKSNHEIADQFSISVRTVETHKQNLLGKTGAKSVAGLVVYAIRYKLVDI
jgi:DNA-binding NarL/FixJ family response regulator